ncbi:glycerol-3-phosphate dehydrogenase [Enteropsectra breve]|nr:glycerol-3-phosphate dehydrogenase [Enteropsectra breve]
MSACNNLLAALLSIIVALSMGYYLKSRRKNPDVSRAFDKLETEWRPPSREQNIKNAAQTYFDICIIGGGASGIGCAFDAALRGYIVILIERGDLGSETSSKSTKLLHGGVSYLIKAVRECSIAHFLFVNTALKERSYLLRMFSYLSRRVKIMVPVYSAGSIWFYWIVFKLYDILSFPKSIGRSFYMSPENTAKQFAMLRKERLKGSLVYYDGMFEDARVNVLLGASAAYHGATVLNHVELIDLPMGKGSEIKEAKCRDTITGKEFSIRAAGFISAAGSFTDQLISKIPETSGYRKPAKETMVHASGSHLVLPPFFGPEGMGLLNVHTDDSRILFILPWKNKTLVGSTEEIRSLKRHIAPKREDIGFMINELKKYITGEVDGNVICSAWSAIRPLLQADECTDSPDLVRKYEITRMCKNMISLSGGKWTLFRKMAEECVSMAISAFELGKKRVCSTKRARIIGSSNYSRDLYFRISTVLKVDEKYARHLLDHYGSRAFCMKPYLETYPAKICEEYEFREAEIVYCIENEYAITVSDIIFNRFQMAYYDAGCALHVIAPIANTMQKYFRWSNSVKANHAKNAKDLLKSFKHSFS